MPNIDLPIHSDNAVPDWIHLLPAGDFISRSSGQSFHATDLDRIIRNSLIEARGKLVLDVEHSTEMSVGKEAHAAGWISEMAARPDGIWGRVDWTNYGRALMEDKAYRAISPVISHDGQRNVQLILSAALTNNPDFRMTTLHSRKAHSGRTLEKHGKEDNDMTMPLSELRARLGLPADASREVIDAALTRANSYKTLHSRVARLAGLSTGGSDEELLAALTAKDEQVSMHKKLLADMTQKHDALMAETKKRDAENFVTEAGRRKIVTEPMKEQLITLHSTNATLAQSIVDSLPDAPGARPSAYTLNGRVAPPDLGSETPAWQRSMHKQLGLGEFDNGGVS